MPRGSPASGRSRRPAYRHQIRSPSAQAPLPISSLAGISLGRRRAPHKGSGGAGCSGGRDARGWAGEGCGAPKQPHGTARNLLRAPGAAQGSPQMPSGIPSLQHPPAMARLDGSFTPCFEHAAQEESRDLPPRSRAPGVHLNFSRVPAGSASRRPGTAQAPPQNTGISQKDARRCRLPLGRRGPCMPPAKSARTPLRRKRDIQVRKSVAIIILLLIITHFFQRRQACCPRSLPLDCTVQRPYTLPPQSGQTICIT